MILFCFLLLNSILSNVSGENSTNVVYKIVETKNGAIRGLVMQTFFNNKSYFAFKGIPFAKPPIGELRYKVSISIFI